MDDADLKMSYSDGPRLIDSDGNPLSVDAAQFDDGIVMTLDLSTSICAYEALPNNPKTIDMSLPKGALAGEEESYFRKIEKPKNGELILNPGTFYLLATKERIKVPPNYCGTMVAYDVSSAESRVHYAGFFDPGFGHDRNGEINGSAGTLEVRVHHTPFRVVDGQPICKIAFHKMRKTPDKVYGKEMGSSYNSDRGPKLPKYFIKSA